MVDTNRQRWNCTFACKVIANWCVLSCCALAYSLQVRGCTDTDLFHNTGDDVQMSCPLSGDDVGTPACRDAESRRQYKNCESTKTCILRFDNTTNSIIFTVVNITEEDFKKYECGLAVPGSKVNWMCCFNLIEVSINLSTDSSMTFSINPTSARIMEYVTKEEPSTSNSTIQQSNPDSHRPTHSTDCETKLELKYTKEYEDICEKSSIMYGVFDNATRNCLTHLIKKHGSNHVTFSVQHAETDRCCNVTCSNTPKRCKVINGCSVGSSNETTTHNQSFTTTGEQWTTPLADPTDERAQGSETTGQIDTEKSGRMDMILYILCGVMLVLMALIVGLCFFLCSEKKAVQTQENSIYSRTLGDVKLTRVVSHAKNSSTSNSNQEECERAENRNEGDSSSQKLTSETSGWEDNIAYEACKYATEGDYADVDDEEDEIVSIATAKENQKSLLNSNANLYECVIDKGK